MRAPVVACLVTLGLCAPGALGGIVTLQPSQDNTLYQDATGSLSNGAGTGVFAGANGSVAPRRGLMQFDLSSIPAGSTITQATLTVHMSSAGATSLSMNLHRVVASWGEGTSVAGSGGGGGAPATPGDATWIHRFYNTVSWATPGGDFAPGPSATTTVAGVGFYSWNGSGMVADVQSWLDSGGNFGWLIEGGEGIAGSAERFDSREIADPSLRPALEVHYIPAPGSLAVLAMGVLGLRRRRR